MTTKRAKMPLNQTEIPVPPSPGAKVELTEEDKAEEYARQMGGDAFLRQARLAAQDTTCTCGAGNDKPVSLHSPGCHKIPLRFGKK